jgi:hypothetical protein
MKFSIKRTKTHGLEIYVVTVWNREGAIIASTQRWSLPGARAWLLNWARQQTVEGK